MLCCQVLVPVRPGADVGEVLRSVKQLGQGGNSSIKVGEACGVVWGGVCGLGVGGRGQASGCGMGVGGRGQAAGVAWG